MKKQLLTTSALVATSMLAASGSASAQTAPASQPIQVTVGGYMNQFFTYISQDDRSTGSTAAQATLTAKPSKATVNSDAEIWFQGKTTLANGISVALRVELEANTEADQIDESFAIVEGAFGRIEIGSTDNSAFKTGIHAPEVMAGIGVAGGYNLLVNNVFVNPTRGSGTQSTFGSVLPTFNDNDSEKISYYTPRFEGFQVGFSYIPELTQDKHNNATGFNTAQSGSYSRGWSAGVNFTRAFGPVDIAASAGYAQFKKPDSSQFFTNTSLSDPKEYTAGLQVGYAGFRLGGSYLRQQDFAVLNTAVLSSSSASSGPGATGATDSWSHGRSFDLGLSYTFGPAVVGVSYFNGRNRGQTAVNGDDTFTAYEVAGRYQLGPGVQVEASVFHARIKGAAYSSNVSTSSAGFDDNTATGVMTGLVLNF
jgi:predicted porin